MFQELYWAHMYEHQQLLLPLESQDGPSPEHRQYTF
jgi:hypothetical protein